MKKRGERTSKINEDIMTKGHSPLSILPRENEGHFLLHKPTQEEGGPSQPVDPVAL